MTQPADDSTPTSPRPEIQAAILAVGTELCLGQITNRNASWLANRLHTLGLFTPFHRVVPDDRVLIREELRDLGSKAQIIILTGGLGPTSDDFTRDCVADVFQRPLEWHESAWTWIDERLGSRGIPVREIQKQQCYFPKGAVILLNEQGTAHGFHLKLSPSETAAFGKATDIFVLPGPPTEVDAVFTSGVTPVLQKLAPQLDPQIVRSWDCLGQGESEIAHRAEAALAGCPFEKAYRVHLPYVEFKLSFPTSQKQAALPWIKKVEQALAEWIVLRDGEDAVTPLLQFARNSPVRICIDDRLTEGLILQRLAPQLKGHPAAGKIDFSRTSDIAPSLILRLETTSAAAVRAVIIRGSLRRSVELHFPWNRPAMAARKYAYFTEAALLFWSRELSAF